MAKKRTIKSIFELNAEFKKKKRPLKIKKGMQFGFGAKE